jgi:DEAD/DEAH box helicase domain-containing protein
MCVMNYLVFDIETKNIFSDVGSNDPAALDISVVSVYNSADKSMQSFLEKDFSKMWDLFEKTDVIVGYNSEHFDIPLLNKYYPGDLNQIKSIDLMVYIKASLGRRPKLDDIAHATLGAKKTAHGLEAVKWWKEGKIDQIIRYCEADVEITHNLFLFARENKFVKLKDFKGEIMKIPIDTTTWGEKKDSGMTHSLPF